MSTRRFSIGVGAQRSGTTWMGHFLRDLPYVSFSPIKEIDCFNSKFAEERKDAIRLKFNTRLAVLGLGNHTRLCPLLGAKFWYHYGGMRNLKVSSRSDWSNLIVSA